MNLPVALVYHVMFVGMILLALLGNLATMSIIFSKFIIIPHVVPSYRIINLFLCKFDNN